MISILIFDAMTGTNVFSVKTEHAEINSEYLDRVVKIDFYLPAGIQDYSNCSLLIINDGQDLVKMDFDMILGELQNKIKPLICAGIHCSADRRMEYGTVEQNDFKGRGAKAKQYADFIFNEFLPFAEKKYHVRNFKDKSYAGFSLGALSALDIVWNYPGEFKCAAAFSGSFWWRSVDQTDKEYNDDKHRIMHQSIRNGKFQPGVKFFFQCGNMDETNDRNKNGIIDSVDDTLDLIKELKAKGYTDESIFYMELPDGKHDVFTWGRAFPYFLKWAF